jgi:hypothetical protein
MQKARLVTFGTVSGNKVRALKHQAQYIRMPVLKKVMKYTGIEKVRNADCRD